VKLVPWPRGRPRTDQRAVSDIAAAAGRRLTYAYAAYALALALVAVSTILGGALMSEVMRRRSDVELIRAIAGRQRSSSLRIVALASDLDASDAAAHEAAARQMSAAVSAMRDAHAWLTEGPDAPALRSADLRGLYFGVSPASGSGSLDARMRAFLDAAAWLASSPAAPEAADVATLRADALGPIADLLARAMMLHDAATRRGIGEMLMAHRVLMGLSLLLLAGEVLVIFRPLARGVTDLAGRLRSEGRQDALTGALNRGETARVAAELAALGPLAVVAVDLDGFRVINSAEGHATGDRLLRLAVSRIRDALRPSDFVGRVGGHRFAALLPACASEEVALAIGERIHKALAEPVVEAGRVLRVGATVGIVCTAGDRPEGEGGRGEAKTDPMAPARRPDAAASLLHVAEDALARAGGARRGSLCVVSAADRDLIDCEAAILRAFDAAGGDLLPGLTVHFQPIVRLDPVAPERAGERGPERAGERASAGPANRGPGHGTLGHGTLGHGTLGHGTLGHGALGDGDLGDGALGDGDLGDGGGALAAGRWATRGCWATSRSRAGPIPRWGRCRRTASSPSPRVAAIWPG
jgi:diguanylate cyclase (GGDEF)-like protein